MCVAVGFSFVPKRTKVRERVKIFSGLHQILTPGVALVPICRSAQWDGWGKAHENAGVVCLRPPGRAGVRRDVYKRQEISSFLARVCFISPKIVNLALENSKLNISYWRG